MTRTIDEIVGELQKKIEKAVYAQDTLFSVASDEALAYLHGAEGAYTTALRIVLGEDE